MDDFAALWAHIRQLQHIEVVMKELHDLLGGNVILVVR